MTHPRTPAQLQPFVDALGTDGAVTFFLTFGGAEFFIPVEPKGASKLVEVMGLDAARALSATAQHCILPKRIPTAKPWIALVWRARGLPKAEIARRLHVTDVTVRRWLAGHGGTDEGLTAPDTDQLSLF